MDQAAAGRPRDRTIDERVLEATRAAVLRKGYAAVSMEAVAREAGVGKQTVYRRWPRKPLLVFDAMFGTAEAVVDVLPDTGSLDDDVRAVTTAQTGVYRTPGMIALLSGLVADCLADTPSLDALRARFLQPRMHALAVVAERAIGRGELRPDVAPEAFAQVLGGAMLAHFVLYGDDGDDVDFGEQLASLVAGVAQKGGRT